MRFLGFLLLASALGSQAAAEEAFDLVIRGGRVVDPESGTDAVRDVGLRGGRIARLSEQPLAGRRVIDAKGLVVAPGFIDLHQHGQNPENDRLKVQDGVTTALELEIGAPDVGAFLKSREGKALPNCGTSASHPWARVLAWGGALPDATGLDVIPAAGPATDEAASEGRVLAMQERLRGELAKGALGIGVGINYTPGATRLEMIEIFRVAAERATPLWPHIRAAGYSEPGSSVESVSELEAATPQARGKGRIREGADADIVIFDPETVADQATYEEPARPSTGFRYVIVGGVPVVDEGRLLAGVHPGRALTGATSVQVP